MKTLQIYDPAMCCSSGVCGPSVDSRLLQLAADIEFLKKNGIQVDRFNLAHQPAAFTACQVVLDGMGTEAENLPIFVVDGVVMSKGTYPERSQIAEWLGLAVPLSEEPRKPLKVLGNTRCC